MSDYLASHLIPLPDLNAMATESDEDGMYKLKFYIII